MFVKCVKRISCNLLARQLLQSNFSGKQIVQSLSTTRLFANQYDDLYTDRKQKFLCEFT